MKYISKTGAELHLRLTKESYINGLISWSQLLQRFYALHSLCAPRSYARKYTGNILRLEEFESEDNWSYEGEDQLEFPDRANQPSMFQRSSDSASSVEDVDEDEDEDEDHNFILFYPAGGTGLSDWEFHLYDNDFFPSVPHGHHLGKAQPKLDPYQGWTYRYSEQLEKVPKKKVIALWNDAAFRSAASRAIDYFLEHHPAYLGWRVRNPRRLPKFR